MRRAGIARAALLAVLWLALFGPDPVALAVGVVAAAAAAWASLRLLPPGAARLSLSRLVGLAASFLGQSVVAGVDVAGRALDPRLPLRPGFVRHRLGLAPGPFRSGFLALSSLLPGTLPAQADPDGAVLFHCLDTRQPVAEQLARAEARFAGVRRRG
ncbi:MAG: Na+/H+ antiporter subunit E [Geminicoccaceae bacterium]